MLPLVEAASWLQRSEINVIMAFGRDCSLTPRFLGGQIRSREGMLAPEPAEPLGKLTTLYGPSHLVP